MAHGHKGVSCCEGIEDAVHKIQDLLQAGDVLLTLGAGDVWKVGEEILAGSTKA
jgi:UDP-N-acetylmuramate--alanine ligase